ncbi:MAG TPA: hypothetical protein PK478_01995 [Nitrospira sp.]|nr:hypothetical protein [Nitrospira sp.]HQW88588.1 hypothetical protein [Nitrospira sp.]
MTLTLATTISRATLLMQDKASTIPPDPAPDMTEAVRQSLAQYDVDVPRSIIVDITGDGSAYDFALPAGFVDGASRVLSIEYPAGEQSPVMLDPSRLTIYRTASTSTLRFLDMTPGSGIVARLSFSAPHTLNGLDSAVATTIPTRHDEAFVTLVGSQGLFLLAAHWLHEQENTIAVDTVDRGSRSEEASRQARALLASYRLLASVPARGAAALSRVQWTSTYAPGVGRLTHRRTS